MDLKNNAMKKIRLLTISPTCERGGSDINLLRLLRSLDKNEYDILHLIPYPGPLADEFRKAGVRLQIVDMPRIRLFNNPLRYIMVLFKFFPTIFKIKKIIEEYNIDIVCTSSMANPYGALAARLAHRPHILFAVEYLPIFRLAGPYFYLLSEKIICCSSMVSRMFKKSDKVLVKYPGVDLDEFSPYINGSNLRKELAVSATLVSMITRLDRWKGVEIFIKAAQYTKSDTKFIIFADLVMGKEKYLKKLEEIIKQLRLEEKIVIKIARCTPQVIAASDIIVHASLRPEPFGLIIIEAMATGKPVIASKLGGPLEIINDELNGILLEPGNPRILAAAISHLTQNPRRAEEIGLKAREKVVKEFNLKEYARGFDTIFKDTFRQYRRRYTAISFSKNGLVKVSFFLAKLLVPVRASLPEINRDAIRKILVIQLFGMGDLLCSLPLIERVRKHFPDAKITLLADGKLSEMAGIFECVDEVIGCQRGILSKMRLIPRIKNHGFDMALILNPLWQGAWIAYLGQVKYSIGYLRDYEGTQDITGLSRLLTHSFLPQDKPMHDSQRYMEIAGFLGIEAVPLLPKLNIPQEAMEWVDAFLRDNGIGQNDLILGINPHAAWEAKCWDAKKFAEVADVMTDNCHAKIVFFGSPDASDTRRMNIINSAMRHKEVVSAAGKTDIPRLIALVKKCDVLLTNDSGPMHLAAALGVNMVALFGPSDIEKFGYERDNIINLKDNFPDNAYMKNIEVKEVIKAIEMLMSVKKEKPFNVKAGI